MISKKLPAFTLIEMTVAMLIAAIAISIAFTSFKIVSGLYINYKRKQDGFSQVLWIQKLLSKDFDVAYKIIKKNDGLELSTHNGIIKYTFEKEVIVRDQASLKVDTFKFVPYAVQYDFERAETLDEHLVDHLSFSIKQDNTVLPMSFFKTYSSTDLINSHAIH
jgi:prepilin-type N-terminal cleavage/methylation domain-containing protein